MPVPQRKPSRREGAGRPSRRGAEPVSGRSVTAMTAEALRSGVLPSHDSPREEIPRESETIRVGDPDDHTLANEYVGEDTPGGSSPTPDQNGVDEIGRAYGLQEEDSGALRSSYEVLRRRDRRRFELQPPAKPEIT